MQAELKQLRRDLIWTMVKLRAGTLEPGTRKKLEVLKYQLEQKINLISKGKANDKRHIRRVR